MIAFGSSITDPEAYKRYAGRGIRLAAEPDSVVFAHSAAGTLYRSYNLILDEAGKLADLEALVLLHQDAEIVDAGFCGELRRALADPDVGVVGCVGAAGVRSLAWWEGAVTWDAFVRAYVPPPAEDVHVRSWTGTPAPGDVGEAELDTLDGFVLALSPWAVRTLRFDESLGLLRHGFDLDFCLQVRAAGRRVVTADLGVRHHHPLVLVTDPESWIEAHGVVAEKWDGGAPGDGRSPRDWRSRARQAEAEAGAARLQGASKLMQAYAQAEMDQSQMGAVTDTGSWRITRPLRELNLWRRERRRDPQGG